MYYIDRQCFRWVHETAPAFQTWRSQSPFSVNLPWTACGFVCNVGISLSFPAPTSSTDLNSNDDQPYKVTPMIESLRTTQNSLFQVCNALWVSQKGRRRGTKSIRARVRARKNRMEPLWEHRFSEPDPRVFPPPGGRFSAPMAENQIYNWACRGAQ